jgi:hypothetical protein
MRHVALQHDGRCAGVLPIDKHPHYKAPVPIPSTCAGTDLPWTHTHTFPARAGFRGGVFQWGTMWNSAAAALGGHAAFIKLMAAGGLFYHLYNQVGCWDYG